MPFFSFSFPSLPFFLTLLLLFALKSFLLVRRVFFRFVTRIRSNLPRVGERLVGGVVGYRFV